MKLRILIFGLLFSTVAPMWAQGGVDVTTLMADTKTFIFSDNQSTVKGYIYEQMEAQSSCCGKDRIYLEVKIDPSGYVLSAKTLTGRNDCFMQSAIDIVKNIKWNTEDFKGGPRSVYFEIKPDISCDGGRANEYAAIEVFNNELLNGTATPNSAPVATAPAPQTQPATPPVTTPATPPASTTPASTPPVTTTPATSEPVAVSTPPATQPEVTEVTEEPAATTQPEVQEEAPIAEATPAAPIVEDEPVVVESIEARTETPSSPPGTIQRPTESVAAAVNPTDPPRGVNPAVQRELTEEEKEAIANQEAERQRRAEEIRQLKEEMARMRESEERERESQRMAAAQRQTQPDPYAYNNSGSDSGSDEEFTGGIPGYDYENDRPLPYEDGGAGQEDQVDPAASQEDRIRNDISSIEQKIRDLENKNRDAESAIRQQMQEADRANREIVQLHEEKIRREEEAAQLRDQRELERIEEDRRRIEQDREKQTAEIQRLQDQLAKLQSDVQVKMSDLDRQQEEIDRIAMQKQQREQEIQLERTLRVKEQEAELERIRLEKMNGSVLASGGINAANIPVDFATAADSEKYVYLVQQIEVLTNEVNILRTQLGKDPLPQTPPIDGGTTETQTQGARISPSITPGSKSAANDRSWEELDFVAPDLTQEDYQIVAKPQPVVTPLPEGARASEPGTPVMENPAAAQPAAPNPADANYRPGRGYSSLSENHGNTAGPELRERTYVNGETALKELVKDNLRAGGVCGLAQVLFSVTLKPDGTVVSYRVLAANTEQVKSQIGTLIPNMKFDAIDARYNQTIYQEIKAEIFCEVEEPANP